jgi:hypothetical protein
LRAFVADEGGEKENFMNAKRPLLLLFVVTVFLFITCAFMLPTAHTAAPNRLLIVRSPVFNDGSVQEMVNRPLLVQQLYYHILSLQPAPKHQACPLYIIAEYQLTFLRSRTSLLKVNVLQGGCPTVTLHPGDKRATDEIFWSLLEQASDFGAQNQPTATAGAGSPTIMRVL